MTSMNWDRVHRERRSGGTGRGSGGLGEWQCSSCGWINGKGPRRHCAKCGLYTALKGREEPTKCVDGAAK